MKVSKKKSSKRRSSAIDKEKDYTDTAAAVAAGNDKNNIYDAAGISDNKDGIKADNDDNIDDMMASSRQRVRLKKAKSESIAPAIRVIKEEE